MTRTFRAVFIATSIFAMVPPRTAMAQITFDEDATLRGIRRIGIMAWFTVHTTVPTAIDTHSVRRSLEAALQLELRRSGIGIQDFPCTADCLNGLGILALEISVLNPGPGTFAAAYQLDFLQQGILPNGYSGFLTTWTTGGLLQTGFRDALFTSTLRGGVMDGIRNFLNAYHKVNPPRR